MSKKTTYYYTKHWEIMGIQVVKSDSELSERGTVYVKSSYYFTMFLNKDAFLTVEEARANVVKRHKAAVKSAQKKLEKLIAFDPSMVTIK